MITKTTIYAIYGTWADKDGKELYFATEATVSPAVKSSRDIENWELRLNAQAQERAYRIKQFFPIRTKYKLNLSWFKRKK